MKKILVLLLVLVLAIALCACNSADYKKAVKAYAKEDYDTAREIFSELGNYEDSATMVKACDYEIACQLLDSGKQEEALALFEVLGNYKDSATKISACNYKTACQLLEAGQLQQALTLFEELGDYEDSADKLKECKVAEIDQILQGDWQAVDGVIVFDYNFSSGRFSAKLSISGSSITNEGSYRIDADAKEIYVCYDYINSTTGKTPNTKEQLLFTYTYDGSDFTMKSTVDMVVTKK